MISRITVPLEQTEYSGLLQMALNELRTPPDQLRHILRRELERIGYLPAADTPEAEQSRCQPTDEVQCA